MSKKQSTIFNMILSLTLIAMVAAGALAAVYLLTYSSIEGKKAEKKAAALEKVLPGFDLKANGTTDLSVPVKNDKDTTKMDTVYVHLAYQKDGQLFGAAVESFTNKAFSGSFSIMVGFDARGNIRGSEVIAASETPGLGEKIKDNGPDNFRSRFVKMNPSQADFNLKVKNDGGDIDAITAATISSRAYCDAVNRAAQAYAKAIEMKGGKQ